MSSHNKQQSDDRNGQDDAFCKKHHDYIIDFIHIDDKGQINKMCKKCNREWRKNNQNNPNVPRNQEELKQKLQEIIDVFLEESANINQIEQNLESLEQEIMRDIKVLQAKCKSIIQELKDRVSQMRDIYAKQVQELRANSRMEIQIVQLDEYKDIIFTPNEQTKVQINLKQLLTELQNTINIGKLELTITGNRLSSIFDFNHIPLIYTRDQQGQPHATVLNPVLWPYSGDNYSKITKLREINRNNNVIQLSGVISTIVQGQPEHYIGEVDENHNMIGKKATKQYINGIYTGDFQGDKRHGKGIFKGTWIYENNEQVEYNGNWENDHPNGMGELKFLRLKKTYNGEFKLGKQDGQGGLETYDTLSHNNTIRLVQFIGNWINGKKEGKGQYYYQFNDNNDIVLTVAHENNMKHGTGILTNYINGVVNTDLKTEILFNMGQSVNATVKCVEQVWFIGKLNDSFDYYTCGNNNQYIEYPIKFVDDYTPLLFRLSGKWENGKIVGSADYEYLTKKNPNILIKLTCNHLNGNRHDSALLTQYINRVYDPDYKTEMKFVNGKRIGDCITFGKDNEIKFKGQIDDNFEFINGQMTFTNNQMDKMIYVGQFDQSQMSGDGILYKGTISPNNYQYVGQWKFNMKNGKGIQYFPQKYYYIGEFKNDKKHGQGKIMQMIGEVVDANVDPVIEDQKWDSDFPEKQCQVF